MKIGLDVSTAGRLSLALALVVVAISAAHAGVRVPTLPDVKPVSAEAQAKAAEAYEKASKALSRRRMESALEHAEAAYAAAPNTSTALLRAVALAANKRHLAAFEAYLVAFSLSPTDQELDYIRKGLQTESMNVTPNLGWLKVTTRPADARVTVGDIGFAPGRVVGISAGDHEIVVRADGYKPMRRELTVTAATSHLIALDLVKEPVVAPPQVEPPKVDPNKVEQGKNGTGGTQTANITSPSQLGASLQQDSDAPVIGGALIGVGGVLIAAAIGTHVWSLGRADDTERLGAPSTTVSDAVRQSQHEAAASDAELGRVLTGISYALGAASLIGGIMVLVLDDGPQTDGTKDTAKGLLPSVWVSPQGASLSLGGHF